MTCVSNNCKERKRLSKRKHSRESKVFSNVQSRRFTQVITNKQHEEAPIEAEANTETNQVVQVFFRIGSILIYVSTIHKLAITGHTILKESPKMYSVTVELPEKVTIKESLKKNSNNSKLQCLREKERLANVIDSI